jgi:hypothetical protein
MREKLKYGHTGILKNERKIILVLGWSRVKGVQDENREAK